MKSCYKERFTLDREERILRFFFHTNTKTMSEKLILYNLNMSPPVRSCKIVAQLLDLELEIR